MYNTKQIEPFIEKVHKEASKAAQKVYNKYNNELIRRVKNQMGKGHIIHSGMGSCSIDNSEGIHILNLNNNFGAYLADNTQYWNNVSAGFKFQSKITK